MTASIVMIALAALAGGCSKVLISDFSAPKLEIAAQYPGIVPVDIGERSLVDAVRSATDNWGADIVVDGILTMLGPDISYRIAHHEDLTEGPRLEVAESAGGVVWEDEAAGVRIIKSLKDKDYGQRAFVFADTDGNRIDVARPIRA